MHSPRPKARSPGEKKRAPATPRVAPRPPLRTRLLDAVTSLRSAIFLSAFVLILVALAVRQAYTQKLHAAGPPGGEEGSATGSLAAGSAEIVFQDPARDLIESIIDRKFERRGQVIGDRLRPDFERVAADLEQLDLDQLRAIRRGDGWVILTAPTRRAEEDPADEFSVQALPPEVYRIRLIRQDNVWKIDRMKKLEAGES